MIRLILFLMLSVMMAGGTSMAEDVSPCSADMVPIQIMGQRKSGNVTTISEARIPGYPTGFSYFVTAVTEHIAAKLDKEKICLDSIESRDQSLIQFVLMPISITEAYPLVSVPPLETKTSCVCRISSPWIDLVIERGEVPRVRGIVRYSERQLLVDQAVLANEPDVPLGVAERLAAGELRRYALEYVRAEILPSMRATQNVDGVPSDLMWLFRRTGHGIVPFSRSVSSALRRAMENGVDGYTKIVIVLVDQCFVSDEVNLHVDSVLDVADLVQLDQYKIVTSIR